MSFLKFGATHCSAFRSRHSGGAYVVHDCFDLSPERGAQRNISGARVPDIILIGSGQDVGLCMRTKEILLKQIGAM